MNVEVPYYSAKKQMNPGEFSYADNDNKGNDLSNDDEVMSGWMRFWAHGFV